MTLSKEIVLRDCDFYIKEYLTTELLKNFLHEDRFIVMSHDPTITELFYKRTLSIPNKHYINPDNIHSNVKLLDWVIFFIIISSLIPSKSFLRGIST